MELERSCGTSQALWGCTWPNCMLSRVMLGTLHILDSCRLYNASLCNLMIWIEILFLDSPKSRFMQRLRIYHLNLQIILACMKHVEQYILLMCCLYLDTWCVLTPSLIYFLLCIVRTESPSIQCCWTLVLNPNTIQCYIVVSKHEATLYGFWYQGAWMNWKWFKSAYVMISCAKLIIKHACIHISKHGA